MPYSTGGIQLDIEALSNNAEKQLNNFIKQLSKVEKATKSIQNIDLNSFTNNINKLSNIDLSGITRAFSKLDSLNPKNLTAFTSVIRNIQKIGSLDSVSFEKITTGFEKLTNSVEPFINKIKEAQPSLQAFSNSIDLGRINAQLSVADARIQEINSRKTNREIIDKTKLEKANVQLEITKKRLDNINNKSDKTSKSFSSLFNLGKIYFLFNYTKRIGQAFANTVSYAIDFAETLNKFQVSLGGYSDEATAFVNKLTYAFNLSRESIMNYMSSFNNMLSALGSMNIDTVGLSEKLTELAIDYASIFNISINTAMEQFQSGIAGQIRALRATSGIDISENSIYALYQQLGGTKSRRALEQNEKRLLRILAIAQQMNNLNVIGDYEKTINSTANQLKQISETAKELSVYLGNILLGFFKPVIQYSLSFTLVMKDIVKSFAILNGFLTEEFNNGKGNAITQINDDAEELEGTLTGLFSFDKFETLSGKSKIGSDIELIAEAINKIDTGFENVTTNARKIADNWLTWLGYTKEIDETTGDTIWKLKDGITPLSLIKDFIQFIATVGLVKIITAITTSIVTMNISLNASGILIGGLVYAVIKLIEWMNQFEGVNKIIAGITMAIMGLTSAIMILRLMADATFAAKLPYLLLAGTLGIAGIANAIKGAYDVVPKKFAKGGFPTKGQMFIANEEGPELVGNIGGRSAVANNEMIVSAIENASYRGMSKAILKSKGNNTEKIIVEFDDSVNANKLARALYPSLKVEARRVGDE